MSEVIKKAKKEKLERIKEAGVNPYPANSNRTHNINEVVLDFEKLSKSSEKVILGGRIRSIRIHGGSTFCHIEDRTGQFQIYFKKDEIGEKDYDFFVDNFDVGDFIEAAGELFITKKEEKTLLVKDYRILAKSLLPLPEKWHGIKDVEDRFRKRYLDLLMNQDVRQKFIIKSKMMKFLRDFLNKRDFMEVETPILQKIPGGANACPFKTHHNALDIDLYLRIAPELYLKRLLVGGYEKIYEIGRCFRNEGIDASHNPEFNILEFYQAYATYEDLMDMTEVLFEEMLKYLSKYSSNIEGTILEYQGQKIDFKAPWKKIEFSELGKTDEELKEAVKNIIQPTFVINHPLEISPLAKEQERNPQKVSRFQLVVGGIEMVNAFSELNNPIEQDKRFKKQEEQRSQGDKEAQRYDKDFVTALEYGMPPAAGFGMGLDRLSLLLTDSHNLRETVLFPLMKPKE